MPRTQSGLPEIIFAALPHAVGQIAVELYNRDPKLRARIEHELGKAARRVSASQIWTDAQNAARLIQTLQGSIDYVITTEGAEEMRKHAARDARAKKSKPVVNEGPYAVLGVRSDAPNDVVLAAWKALAQRFHPDRPGGSEEKMKRVNAAMDEIRKERKL